VSRDAKLRDDPSAIKKIINTELFIDRMAALYMLDGQINEKDLVRVVNHWYWLIRGSSIFYAKITKRCSSLIQNKLNRNVKEKFLLQYLPRKMK